MARSAITCGARARLFGQDPGQRAVLYEMAKRYDECEAGITRRAAVRGKGGTKRRCAGPWPTAGQGRSRPQPACGECADARSAHTPLKQKDLVAMHTRSGGRHPVRQRGNAFGMGKVAATDRPYAAVWAPRGWHRGYDRRVSGCRIMGAGVGRKGSRTLLQGLARSRI